MYSQGEESFESPASGSLLFGPRAMSEIDQDSLVDVRKRDLSALQVHEFSERKHERQVVCAFGINPRNMDICSASSCI
jgi:hypothetical protein